MNDLLLKYYNLEHINSSLYGDGYLFVVNGKKYYLIKTNYTESMIEDINQMIVYLHNRKVLVHSIIKNVNGLWISDGYILMKINTFGEEVTMYDINLFGSVLDDMKMYKNMNSFWYEKLDYLDKQRYELSSNTLINNSFDYYLGIAELLLKNLQNNYNQTRICLSHKTLSSLSIIDFYNPLNISYDVWLKDIGYYIKITRDYKLLDNYLDRLNKYELNYLFTRLCFPFEYFNEVSNVIIDKKNERNILNIVTDVDNYEKHLFNMEHIFGIYLFEWIKK